MFIFYQQLHAKHFRGASQGFLSFLIFTGFIGMATGLVFLVYYGIKVVWWAPLALFGLGLAFQLISNMIENLIGAFALSILGFVVWPVCAFLMFASVPDVHVKSQEMETVVAFTATMESANLASRFVNKGVAFSVMSQADTDDMMRHYRVALVHAEKVDTNFLNEKYDGWGTHFEKEFLSGLRLVVEGDEKVDATISRTGQKLMDSWGNWFNDNVKEIRKL
jgi:membrane-bound ClpP family serine protease